VRARLQRPSRPLFSRERAFTSSPGLAMGSRK
jgi:hypothetical protein